jgi:acyl dehydratase
MIDIEDIRDNHHINFHFKYTKKVHYDFVKFSGDNSKIHTDKEFAQQNGYNDVLGFAFVLPIYLSNIYGTKFPGGNELCLRQECNFRNPFYIGDTIIFDITVQSVNRALQTIELSSSVTTERGVLIFTGLAMLKLSLI